MVTRAGASHIGSSLSVIDVLSVLYAGAANVSPSNFTSPNRDLVIVSKGHAAAGTYAVMAHAGFFDLNELGEFCKDGAMLGGHVTAGVVPGVEVSTGSLGHGLSFGCGVALAALRDASARRIFVVMSDGECDEGSVWEAALFAAHHNLSNLTAIIDRNGLQSFGSTETTLALEPLDEKWRAFNWTVTKLDGHDHLALNASLALVQTGPHVLIAQTTKGKGVTFMHDQVRWHYATPNPEELQIALSEILGRNA
jgi:transketolase